MPDGFPSDVPVHPGTVTAYEAIEVTESSTVHQLTVETEASFDDVVAWYESSLPQGWEIGYLETEGDAGRGQEGKVSLNGGDYAPADPGGMGGGVIVGLFDGDVTAIVTTVTVME